MQFLASDLMKQDFCSEGPRALDMTFKCTYAHSHFREDGFALLERLDGLEVQLDSLVGAVSLDDGVEELLERQVALLARWMRHYRDISGGAVVVGIVKLAYHDVALQHHDVVFKKESRLSAGSVCVRVRVSTYICVRRPWLRRPAGWRGVPVCAYTCREYRSCLKRLEDSTGPTHPP